MILVLQHRRMCFQVGCIEFAEPRRALMLETMSALRDGCELGEIKLCKMGQSTIMSKYRQ
jgi:hypothetical protein